MSLDPADVCAVLVTRGDVDMQPIIDSLPYGQIIVWDNAATPYSVEAEGWRRPLFLYEQQNDYKVFGRYVAIPYATKPVIFFQDDDCIVRNHDELLAAYKPGYVVGNMKNDGARLRYFQDTVLLGWGALFERHLPFRAFWRYARHHPIDSQFMFGLGAEFTWPMLTPSKRIITDIEWLKEDGEMVFGRPDRMSNQPGFYEELDMVLKRAREVRDMR